MNWEMSPNAICFLVCLYFTLCAAQHEFSNGSGSATKRDVNQTTSDISLLHDYRVITVGRGNTVYLSCGANATTQEKVSWKREIDNDTQFLCEEDTCTHDPNIQSFHSDFDKDWVLRINLARLEDSGIYICQVNTSLDSRHYIELKVEETGGDSPHSPFHYVKYGSTLELVCVFSAGTESDVAWFKGNRRIPEGSSSEANITTDYSRGLSTLTVDYATEKQYALYSCSANSGWISIIVYISDRPQFLKYGGFSTMRCTYNKTIGMSWVLDNAIIGTKSMDVTIDTSRGSGKLFVNSSTSPGVYSCSINSGRRRWVTDLSFENASVEILGPSERCINHGEEMVLVCKFEEAENTRGGVTWMKDGKELWSSSEDHSCRTSTLSVNYATSEHSGLYKCSARYYDGEAYTSVIVRHRAVISGPPDNFINTGTPFNLTCTFNDTGDVAWYLNSKILDDSDITTDASAGVSTLTVSSASNNHSGIYSCESSSGRRARYYAQIHDGPAVVISGPTDPFVEFGAALRLVCSFSEEEGGLSWYLNNTVIETDGDMNIYTDIHNGTSVLLVDSTTYNHTGTYSCALRNEKRANYNIQVLHPLSCSL